MVVRTVLDFSYCRKNEYKTSLQEKTVAISMEKEICVQKVKDKKKEIKKKQRQKSLEPVNLGKHCL